MTTQLAPLATRRAAPEESPVPEHHTIFEYWKELCGDRFAPTWEEFDLANLDPKVVPWTAVVDISPDFESIIYRFWGTQLTEVRGFDFTNRPARDVPPLDLGEFIHESYVTTARDKKPCLDIEEYVSPTGRKGIKSVLRLPLSDDGERVNRVVACMIYDISFSGKEVRDFLESVHDD